MQWTILKCVRKEKPTLLTIYKIWDIFDNVWHLKSKFKRKSLPSYFTKIFQRLVLKHKQHKLL